MQRYRIIGADGREYGPITAEQLKQWIAENRANAQTRVRPEDAAEWRTLGELPEFATLLPGAATAPPGSPPGGMSEADVLARDILARDYTVQIGHCLGRGWDLVMAHFWLTAGGAFIVYLLSVLLAASALGHLLLAYVLWAGLDWLLLKLVRGQPAELADIFAGFSLGLVPLLLFSLVGQLLTAVGLVLCIVPGIYLLVAWHLFTPLLILDKRLDFWSAMELSRKVATRHWWQLFGLCLLCVLCLLAGTILCLVGFFIALPVTAAAVVYAYNDIFGPRPVSFQAPAPGPAAAT